MTLTSDPTVYWTKTTVDSPMDLGGRMSNLTREERRRRRRANPKYRRAHATRERERLGAFNMAFAELSRLLPILPPEKSLSKIEILRLAIRYISYLNHVLDVHIWQHSAHSLPGQDGL